MLGISSTAGDFSVKASTVSLRARPGKRGAKRQATNALSAAVAGRGGEPQTGGRNLIMLATYWLMRTIAMSSRRVKRVKASSICAGVVSAKDTCLGEDAP